MHVWYSTNLKEIVSMNFNLHFVKYLIDHVKYFNITAVKVVYWCLDDHQLLYISRYIVNKISISDFVLDQSGDRNVYVDSLNALDKYIAETG